LGTRMLLWSRRLLWGWLLLRRRLLWGWLLLWSRLLLEGLLRGLGLSGESPQLVGAAAG